MRAAVAVVVLAFVAGCIEPGTEGAVAASASSTISGAPLEWVETFSYEKEVLIGVGVGYASIVPQDKADPPTIEVNASVTRIHVVMSWDARTPAATQGALILDIDGERMKRFDGQSPIEMEFVGADLEPGGWQFGVSSSPGALPVVQPYKFKVVVVGVAG